MDSLFSHGSTSRPADAGSGGRPDALDMEVIVPQTLKDSFTGFTDGIHLWWPAEQTRFGEGTHPEFTGGELFEEDASGRSALWATLLEPASNAELVLAWHHEGNPNLSSRVVVSFTPDGASTRVRVQHDGWAEGPLGREQLAAAPDWAAVLTRYQRFMGGAA